MRIWKMKKRITLKNFDAREFWTNPEAASDELKAVNGGRLFRFCQPEFYLKQDWGQRIALNVMTRYAQKDWTFLEVGCNTGKVMAALIEAGYKNISGIEINKHAIEIGQKAFSVLKTVSITCAPLEDVIRDIPEVDMIYACGVLMHLPHELDWVFPVIASKARKLILTTENETETDFFKWGRNYREVYEPLGWKQVEEQSGALYPPLPASSIVRVFVKA